MIPQISVLMLLQVFNILHTYFIFIYFFYSFLNLFMAFILQWNCNGFYRHKEELAVLINDFNPLCICVQETHFKSTDKGILKGYNMNRFDDLSGRRAQGGVAIAVREALHTSLVQLTTPFQAVAVTVHAPLEVTLCNVYLPEDAPVNVNNLQALIRQLPRPYILLGDFNAHDPLWGGPAAQCNRRGRILSSFFHDFNLLLLNNGEKTRFNSFNGEYSSIDLCLCTSSIFTRLKLSVHMDLCGSDHFPILIKSDLSFNTDFIREGNWIVHKADWSVFKKSFNFIYDALRGGTKNVEVLTASIVDAAKQSVPVSKGAIRRPAVPWWNEDCAEAIKKRKRALRIFNKFPTASNLASFRRLRARARLVIKESKKASWMKYVSSINNRTPLSQVWNKVRAISGTRHVHGISCLRFQGVTIHTPGEICDVLGQSFAKTSSDESYPAAFLSIRERSSNFSNFAESDITISSPYGS